MVLKLFVDNVLVIIVNILYGVKCKMNVIIVIISE